MKVDAIRSARVPALLARRHGVRPVLEHWLAGADPSNHGLPAQAIVLVRRLQASWRQVAHPDRAARYQPLAAALAGARRPALDPRDGDVVWFADEAELLACLARDALAGRLALRWWWRAWLRDGQPAAARAAWQRAPRSVPAALLRLGVQPALAWLSGWREAERRQLVAQLAQAYPVAPAVCDVLCEVGPASPPGHALTPLPWLASHPRSPAAERAVARRLDASRLYRLGVSLAGDPMAMADPARGLDLLDAPAWRPRRGEGGGPDVEPHARDVLTSPSSVTPPPVRRSLGPVEPVGREPEPATPVEPLMADGTSADDHVPAPTHPPPSLAPPLALPLAVAVATQPTPPAVSAPAATGVDTSYGGLLFLLNAALQLGLYGDFTQPQHRGLTCSPWRFLLQAGRALCGRGFASDPLAAWLRGRDTAGVALPPMDRLPADWLQPFSSAPGAWQAVFETGRLRLRHPAGFSVVDIPATSEGREALIRAELGRLGAGVPALRRTVRLPRHAQRPRRPHLLWPYLRARLALALGTPARRLAALLRLPARVHDTGSRVDVHIALDALPLTVRLAGLDRDPGWIPAAGCDLRFHFG